MSERELLLIVRDLLGYAIKCEKGVVIADFRERLWDDLSKVEKALHELGRVDG